MQVINYSFLQLIVHSFIYSFILCLCDRLLHQNADLFLYCGHGSGDKFIDSYKLRHNKIPCSMLWGCSSGKLITHGIHDPVGTALNYLLGGARFVIGNLWDVTDRDIDKYSINCMSLTFPNDNQNDVNNENQNENQSNVVEAVQKSRDVCKLKYIVGSSPVIYGIKVDITHS